jgi:hypothetical protein
MHPAAYRITVIFVLICLAFHSIDAQSSTATARTAATQSDSVSMTDQTGTWTATVMLANATTVPTTTVNITMLANNTTTTKSDAGVRTSIIMPLMIIGSLLTLYFNR